MGKFIDLTGQKFGRLTAIKRVENTKNKDTLWLCKCDCGGETITRITNLRNGNTKSCGCLNKEHLLKSITKHGLHDKKLYNTWKGMRQRCNNKNNPAYKNYGGRGITICAEWNNFKNFYDWAMNNGYQKGLSIDRIDNNKGYNPNNCRFTDQTTQSNNRRNNKIFTYKEQTHTLAEWAIFYNMNYWALRSRIKRGWSIEKTLETPL